MFRQNPVVKKSNDEIFNQNVILFLFLNNILFDTKKLFDHLDF